jgi:hypothetical protein
MSIALRPSCFHAIKIEILVTGDLLRHFMNERLRYVAGARNLLTIRLHEKIENPSIGDMLGEIGGAGEGMARVTA